MNIAPMSYLDDENRKHVIANLAKHSIIANAISPFSWAVCSKGFACCARILAALEMLCDPRVD